MTAKLISNRKKHYTIFECHVLPRDSAVNTSILFGIGSGTVEFYNKVKIQQTLAGSGGGKGQRWKRQSYPDNGHTGERWLKLRTREPQGSPLSRWGCICRVETIRPALILHLLFIITAPSART